MNASEEKLLRNLRGKIGNIQAAIAELQAEAAEVAVLVSVLHDLMEERAVFDAAGCSSQGEQSAGVRQTEVEEIRVGGVDNDIVEDPETLVSDAASPGEVLMDERVEDERESSVGEDKSPGYKAVDARLLTDLRKAIGLNDRFRFRHDLFANDDKLMMDTIDTLNNVDSFDEALSYLRENFDWDEDNPTVTYLLDILHRRYYV